MTQPRQIALARGYISLLILFAQKQLDVHIFITKILENISSLRLDAGYVPTLRILADGFNVIYSQCDSFVLGEHLLLGLNLVNMTDIKYISSLIDSWIAKYLNICSLSEREILLDRLNETLIKVSTLLSNLDSCVQRQNCVKLIEAINKHVLPYIQHTFTETYEGVVIPKLAANLCLFNKFGVKELNQELFKSFVENQKTDVQ